MQDINSTSGTEPESRTIKLKITVDREPRRLCHLPEHTSIASVLILLVSLTIRGKRLWTICIS